LAQSVVGADALAAIGQANLLSAIFNRVSARSVDAVHRSVTVKGAAFSSLSVINLFNAQGGGIANLGGFNAEGMPSIPPTNLSDTQFTFQLPAGIVGGPAYVQVLNPPFVSFSSTGNTPAGLIHGAVKHRLCDLAPTFTSG